MKEKLTPENRIAIVTYRLERAHETLKEADYNTDGGYYNAAVNVCTMPAFTRLPHYC